MPRYDYRCEAGHKYELQQPFGSPTEHPCERCGKPARRQLVAPPLVFKSGGFYKTSGRGDSGSSGSSDSPKGVRSKTPPKKSEGSESSSDSSSAASTASAAASDE
jgi:putative FmdB family regulatory protein